VLTVFAVPKAFRDHAGMIQRNALHSWRQALPDAQIILLGDDPGVAEAARAIGAEHVHPLAVSRLGTPLLSDAFRKAQDAARFDTLLYVNADIILRRDLQTAVCRLPAPPFLMVGESRDVPIHTTLAFDDDGLDLRLDALWRTAPSRGPFALDYFVFSRGLFDGMPPFVVGRARFDNWLVWKARDVGATVIDGSAAIRSLHQAHDYQHVPGPASEKRPQGGAESRENQRLAGWPRLVHLRGLYDCTHVLTPEGLRERPWVRAALLRQLVLRARLKLSGR
jgi:hypothetical protein